MQTRPKCPQTDPPRLLGRTEDVLLRGPETLSGKTYPQQNNICSRQDEPLLRVRSKDLPLCPVSWHTVAG